MWVDGDVPVERRRRGGEFVDEQTQALDAAGRTAEGRRHSGGVAEGATAAAKDRPCARSYDRRVRAQGRDRKSAQRGKSVDLGGRRILKNKRQGDGDGGRGRRPRGAVERPPDAITAARHAAEAL